MPKYIIEINTDKYIDQDIGYIVDALNSWVDSDLGFEYDDINAFVDDGSLLFSKGDVFFSAKGTQNDL